jgi:hypothetical protein
MKCPITRVCSRGNHRLEVVYADGLSANLDFTHFLAEREGPIVEPLRDELTFSGVRLEEGVVRHGRPDSISARKCSDSGASRGVCVRRGKPMPVLKRSVRFRRRSACDDVVGSSPVAPTCLG